MKTVISLPATIIILEERIVRDKITGDAGIDENKKQFTTIKLMIWSFL